MRHRAGFHGITSAAIFGLALGLYEPSALADPADYFLGAGARAGFNDETAAVINAKVKVADFGEISLSGRPAIFLGSETEFRLALTGEGEIAPNCSPFVGGGLAVNTDGSGNVDPMLSAGVDFQLAKQVVMQVGGNFIFEANDTDTELIATVNYAF